MVGTFLCAILTWFIGYIVIEVIGNDHLKK